MLIQKELKEISKGDLLEHYLLIKKCEVRQTKAGKNFFSLELGDKTSSINANMWESFEYFAAKAETGNIVFVKGNVDEYMGSLQLKVNSIRLTNEKDNVSHKDFLPVSLRNPDEMKKEFFDRIELIKNEHLKKLLLIIFEENNFNKYINAPAGKSLHHSYIHGLIEHTLEIIRICDLMCDIHPEIDRDLLITAAMLHDFGKTEELSYETSFDYTDKGKLIGHIVIAAMLINEKTKLISGFPEELKNKLIHIVLSHQGKLEFASPVVPKMMESIVLYQADELSAKTNSYKLAIKNDQSGNNWTKYQQFLGTEIFIPKENDNEEPKTLFD